MKCSLLQYVRNELICIMATRTMEVVCVQLNRKICHLYSHISAWVTQSLLPLNWCPLWIQTAKFWWRSKLAQGGRKNLPGESCKEWAQLRDSMKVSTDALRVVAGRLLKLWWVCLCQKSVATTEVCHFVACRCWTVWLSLNHRFFYFSSSLSLFFSFFVEKVQLSHDFLFYYTHL